MLLSFFKTKNNDGQAGFSVLGEDKGLRLCMTVSLVLTKPPLYMDNMRTCMESLTANSSGSSLFFCWTFL